MRLKMLNSVTERARNEKVAHVSEIFQEAGLEYSLHIHGNVLAKL